MPLIQAASGIVNVPGTGGGELKQAAANSETEPPNAPRAAPSTATMSQLHRRPSWAEWITAGFTVVLALATLALVFTAVIQHQDAVDAINETRRLATASENTLSERRQVSSGELVLKFGDKLDDSRYKELTAEIQGHDGRHPLLSRGEGGRGGKFRDIDIEQYISIFEDLGYLVHDNLIISKMAYDHFSYDIEKAWCNADIQQIIKGARKADKSIPGTADLFYVNFETLAKNYLAREGQSCKDLDNQ
jgi:hypothetical protein